MLILSSENLIGLPANKKSTNALKNNKPIIRKKMKKKSIITTAINIWKKPGVLISSIKISARANKNLTLIQPHNKPAGQRNTTIQKANNDFDGRIVFFISKLLEESFTLSIIIFPPNISNSDYNQQTIRPRITNPDLIRWRIKSGFILFYKKPCVINSFTAFKFLKVSEWLKLL